ncbi:MAG: bifunctional precorrin-2 dehydrogenase/sirohydrochlorin ferrochelatase [Clostridiales bacterium]|nr:bifunctional precorrin-2 dehydrogenase/sirohydrochlorin ferrochelatase [Clostridiales bacterium]
MALFPMFVDLSGRYCLVLGAGAVALRKIHTLLAAGARVHVWSKEVCEDIVCLAGEGKVILEDGNISPKSLIPKAFLVICATSDPDFNERMLCLCRQCHIFVNCATENRDAKENGSGGPLMESGYDTSFIFPSLIVRDTISVGISTFPPAPSLSRYIRQRLDACIPGWYGRLGRSLYKYRKRLRKFNLTQPGRARIMERLTEYGLSHEGNIPGEIFLKYLNEERKL